MLGLATDGVALAVNRSPQEENVTSLNEENLISEEVNINIDDLSSYSSEAEKETALYNFLADTLSLEVEKTAGISDCVIDITRLNSELLGADVSITINDSFDNTSESDIRAYVAEGLGISAENVKISCK